MFLLFFIAWPLVEILVFVEVALAIGWIWALVLLIGTSLLGLRMARRQGRVAIEELSRALAARRPPGVAVLDGALGSIGGLLLLVPGFVSDALGALLLLPPARRWTRRWLTTHYGGLVVSFAVGAGRFAGAARRPADVESTAIEEDAGQLPL